MNVLVGLLIVVVVVTGVSSNVLSLDLTSLASKGDPANGIPPDPYANFTNAELQALDFLRINAPAGSTVLGLSTVSNRLAYVFSGMNHFNSITWLAGDSSDHSKP